MAAETFYAIVNVFRLFCHIVEGSNAVELEFLEELIRRTTTLSAQAVGRNLILLDEGVLHGVGTINRQFVVQLQRTLGRSITLHLHLGLGMILHVRSNQLNGSILSRINHALTLAEENGRLQVGSSSGLHIDRIARLAVASVESSLQVTDLSILGSQQGILVVQVSTQLVDLIIQTVNLSLVTELSNLEIVGTVAVQELVVYTNKDTENSVRKAVPNAVVVVTVEGPYHVRLNVELPSLLLAEVEREVDTGL